MAMNPSLWMDGQVMSMAFNLNAGVVVSGDKNGIIEYWSSEDYGFPQQRVSWKVRHDSALIRSLDAHRGRLKRI